MQLTCRIGAASACAALLAVPVFATAQMPRVPVPIMLPDRDFTWVWGNRRRAMQGRTPDFTIFAVDFSFNCELTGRVSPQSLWARGDIDDMEIAVRSHGSFIEGSLIVMNQLESQRILDWAQLDCERFDGDQGGPQEPQGPQTAVAWLDMEVRLHEAFTDGSGVDGVEWTATFNQAQSWRLRASRPDSRATYTARSEGLLLPSALTGIEASAYTHCTDASGREWRTEWVGPAEPELVSLSASNEDGNLVLWASVPDVLMQHPGHGHIDANSECRITDQASRERLQIDWAALQAAGAPMNDSGAFQLGIFPWSEIATAASGTGPAAGFQMRHEAEVDGRRIVFEISGSLGQRPTD